jgi:hypothetical protein
MDAVGMASTETLNMSVGNKLANTQMMPKTSASKSGLKIRGLKIIAGENEPSLSCFDLMPFSVI